MQAVILAGGNGPRLHTPISTVPKPMLPLFDCPVMEHTIRLLAKQDIRDIIVIISDTTKDLINYFSDGSRWGVNIRYSVETEPMGTAGSVKTIQSMINGTFVIVPGDAITDFDLADALHKHRSASAITSVLLYEDADPTEFGVPTLDADGKIIRFIEKPRASEALSNTISTGIYILEPEALSCIPYGREFDFARELFPRMLNNQEPVYGFPLSGYWCDISNPMKYRNVHSDALREKVKLDLPATHIGEGIWLGEGVAIDSSAEITGPLFLGSGVSVKRNAILGERTVIGPDSLIGDGARITRSALGSHSHIGSNTTVSDCIIGSGYILADDEDICDRILLTGTRYSIAPKSTPSIRTPGLPVKQPVKERINFLELSA